MIKIKVVILAIATILVASSNIQLIPKTSPNKMSVNEYLKANYKNSDWFNAMLRNRLTGLKGKIRRMTQQEYNLNETTGSFEIAGGTTNFTLLFNKNFQIIEEWSDGGKSITTYRNFIEDRIEEEKWFNENGELIQIEIYRYSKSNLPVSLYTKKLNGTETNITFSIEHIDDNSFIYHGRYFDELYVNGKNVEKKSNYSELRIKYEYSQPHYTKYEYSGDRLYNLEIFNGDGYLIERIHYYEIGKETLREKRKYDDRHNLVEIASLGSDYQSTTVFNYDAESNLVEEKRLSKELEVIEVKNYQYDAHGNCIVESSDSYPKIEIKYTYDRNGNWIEKLKLRGSIIINKITRQIAYFD